MTGYYFRSFERIADNNYIDIRNLASLFAQTHMIYSAIGKSGTRSQWAGVVGIGSWKTFSINKQ
jgi:hypothetical protein